MSFNLFCFVEVGKILSIISVQYVVHTTHHKRRSVPSEYGFNIACVEGAKIEDYKDVRYLDDRVNHPKATN